MKFFNLLLLCLSCTTAFSQALSCDDLFKYALENSPTIKSNQLDVLLADQQIKQALTAGYPKINGTLSFQNFIDIPTTVVPAAAFDPTAMVLGSCAKAIAESHSLCSPAHPHIREG